MDFGWKKDDPVDDNQNTTISDQAVATTTAGAQTSQPTDEERKSENAGPLAIPNLTPDADEKVAEAYATEKDKDVFETNKKDDSFSDDFTVDSAATSSQSEDSPMNKEGSLSDGSSSDPEFRDPIAPANRGEGKKVTGEDVIPAEKSEPTVPTIKTEESTPSTTTTSGDSSLSDLEKKVSAQKEDANKQLSELQAKVDKLDELVSKIQKMKDEEQSLIQEISSSI